MGANASTDAAVAVIPSSVVSTESKTSTGKCPVQHTIKTGEYSTQQQVKKGKLVPGSWIDECLSDAGQCPVNAGKEAIDPKNMVSI